MEKEEYIQRFEFTTITPFKDYSRLDERPNTPNSFLTEQEENDEFSNFFRLSESKHRKYKVTSLPEKRGNKKLFFFSTKDETQERFNIKYVLSNPINDYHSFDTTKDSQIKRHFGKPFSEIICHVYERSIKRNGDKVTIKTYVRARMRGFNCIYFKKNETIQSVTVNLKTGDIILFDSSKVGKRKSSRIRKNDFFFLHSLLHINGSFFNLKKTLDKNSRLYDSMDEIFDDVEFTKQVQKFIGIPPSHINYSSNVTTFVLDLIDFFVKKKEIKIPNGNFVHFMTKFYPTKKYLKKNDNKLIASVLDMIGIKSKITIKILHKNQHIDLFSFKWLCEILGNNYTKYLSNIKEDVFNWKSNRGVEPFTHDGFNKHLINYDEGNKKFYLKDVEKENLIRILNSDGHLINFLNESNNQELSDHFKMIHKLREYLPDLYMKARTHQELTAEHRELSKMIAAIKKGWVIEYQYDEKTISEIERPIDFVVNLGTDDDPIFRLDTSMGDKKLYPRILKREEEYVEEGSFMHHCVASYSDKDKSMIVSLRTEDENDRVTIEYDIQTGKPVQKRHFCNGNPPQHFYNSIIMLDTRIKQQARWGTLNWKEKKKVPVIINGVQIQQEQLGPRTPFGAPLPF